MRHRYTRRIASLLEENYPGGYPSLEEIRAYFEPDVADDIVRILASEENPSLALAQIAARIGAQGTDERGDDLYVRVDEPARENPNLITFVYDDGIGRISMASGFLYGGYYEKPVFDKPIGKPQYKEPKKWWHLSEYEQDPIRFAQGRDGTDASRDLGFGDYYEEEGGMVGWTESGRWGNQGSGLLLTDGERIFLGLRSPYVHQPNVWGIPGGAIPQRGDGSFMRTPQENAKKEFSEEMGGLPPYAEIDRVVFEEGPFCYTTIIGLVDPSVPDTFRASYNWENTDSGWFRREELDDYDLHFGLDYVLSQTNPFTNPRREAMRKKPNYAELKKAFYDDEFADEVWVITRDVLAEEFGDEPRAVGRRSVNAPDSLDPKSLPFQFKMGDDDGTTYYVGRSSEELCAPLYNFGAGYAGCTWIAYRRGNEPWEQVC